MRYKWGIKSIKKIKSCDCRIQKLMKKVIETSDFDITVLCGYRSQEEQDKLYAHGRTIPGKKVTWTKKSRHSSLPSQAIDLAPYPIDWSNIDQFKRLGDHVLKCAKELNMPIVWGGKWGNPDYPHFELRRG